MSKEKEDEVNRLEEQAIQRDEESKRREEETEQSEESPQRLQSNQHKHTGKARPLKPNTELSHNPARGTRKLSKCRRVYKSIVSRVVYGIVLNAVRF